MLKIALVTLGDPTRLTGGYMYHLRVSELAPRFGAHIKFVSFPDWPFPLGVLAAPAVMRRVRQSGAQAILLDSIAAAFLGPWLLLRGCPLPLIAILHQPPGGIDHGPLRQRVQVLLDRLAYRGASKLLIASQDLANNVAWLDNGRAIGRIQVVCPGRDVAEAADDSPGDLRRGRRAAFLCVGNWVRRKDILRLLQAFATLPEEAATLHLVGDESLEPDYESEIRVRLARADLQGRVVRHGKRTRGQVAALYAAADAFVLASLVEPYGTVWGEAMAAGLPVAGWRAGNLPFLAENEREGLFVEPGDMAGLAGILRRLSDDPALRARLAAAAYARAQSFPTWDDTTRDIVEAVRAAVQGGGAPCATRQEIAI